MTSEKARVAALHFMGGQYSNDHTDDRAQCVLFNIHGVRWHGERCLLPAACCLLPAAQCVLHAAH